MAIQRRSYDKQFKLDALQLWKNSGKPAHLIEQELGFGKGLLNKWKRSLASEGTDAFRGNGRQTSAQERNRQLERELSRVTEEREIVNPEKPVFSRAQTVHTRLSARKRVSVPPSPGLARPYVVALGELDDAWMVPGFCHMPLAIPLRGGSHTHESLS